MKCLARTYLHGPRCSRKARDDGYCFQHEAPTGDFLVWQTEANEMDERVSRAPSPAASTRQMLETAKEEDA